MPIRHLTSLGTGSNGSGQTPKKLAFRPRWKTIFLWIVTIGGGLAILGALTFTILLAWFSRDLPNPNTLMERTVPQSTKIYDKKGETLLYEIHGDENRTLIQIKDLPAYVPAATVSIEDKRFYQHNIRFGYSTSITAAISTATLPGSEPAPSAKRAWRPASPNSATSKSEAPFATFG